MPIYYARGVSVRLGAMPLVDTVTPDIVLKKGETARKQCEEAEQKLLGSELLPEERVIFPGDDGGFELNWLGGAPFMQVKTGNNLFEQDSDECFHFSPPVACGDLHQPPAIDGSYSDQHEVDQSPLALILHVKLSDKTFVHGFNKHNKVHLKIDVFFNGQLSSCMFVPPYDIRSGAKSLHQVFAGYRVDFLSERPWVVLPPNKNANGSTRKMRSVTSAQRRWEDICKALGRESDERGMDMEGKVPPSAEYLKALARMPMPDQARSIQKPGSRTFGVVDVVITAGEGRKVTSGTTYLKAPLRLADEKYISALSQNAVEEDGPGDGWNRAKEQEVHERSEASAERDSEPEYEPRPKRQALVPCVLSMRPTAPAGFSPLSRNHSKDAQILSIPAPVVAMPDPSFASPAAKISSSTLSTSRARNRVDNAFPSPERGRANPQEYTNDTKRHMLGGEPYGTPHTYPSFPGSNISHARTLQMHPSPYSFQFSDSALGQDSPSSLLNIASFDNPCFLSSPLVPVPRRMIGSSSYPQLSQWMRDAEVIRGHDPHLMPIAFPEPPQRVSVDSNPAQPGAISTWSTPTSTLGLQSQDTSGPPGHVPKMSISTPLGYNDHSIFGRLPFSPSFDPRLSMPLPPTGFFSVPTKPRSSLFPPKRSRPVDLENPRRSFFVKRLIITGKDGATIVDQQWPANVNSSLRNSPNKGSRGFPGASARLEAPNAGRRSSRSIVSANSAPRIPKPEGSKSAITSRSVPKKHGSVQDTLKDRDVPCAESPSPQLSVDGGNERTVWEGSTAIAKCNMLPQAAKTAPRKATKPAMPQRRTSSGTNIVDLQGPKATTFWLEDPEKVLREAAKLRRSRSPKKCKNKPAATFKRTTSAQVEPAQDVSVIASSSPLSSLATTPEPDAGFEIKHDRTALMIHVPTNIAGPIAQIDGSPERKVVATSSTKLTPSPTKLTATTTPRFPPKTLSTPISSVSPNTKKRKAQGRYLPKQPRSPDRLKTISNPSLNRDCVIAFAESEDKKCERGVLRQVRGERQGVFAEEYVVLATRFFIPGN